MSRGKGKRTRRCRRVAFLPIDIIEKEILCRLPVKSILRCKSVCKLWYSVIKSPKFISNHYHHQSNRTSTIAVENFLVIRKEVPIVFNPANKPSYAVWPIVNGGRGGVNFLFSYYVGLPFEGMVARPVNGFFLLVLPNKSGDRCRMAMFNPATRQFRKLSDFKFNASKGLLLTHNQIFGYGICKYSNVYKVVWLTIQAARSHVSVAKVYTVGSGSRCRWRKLNADLPRHFVHEYYNRPEKNISMNGKCYWLSKDFTRILVFDMDEEVFQEMNSPVPSVYHSPQFFYNPMVWEVVFSEVRCSDDEGYSLALFIFGSDCVDISVMAKEEEWHWIRRVVTCIDRPLSDVFNPLLQFQFPVTDSTILLKSGRCSLALYDPKTNGCVHFCKEFTEALCASVSVFNFKENLFYVDGGVQVSDPVLKKFCTF